MPEESRQQMDWENWFNLLRNQFGEGGLQQIIDFMGGNWMQRIEPYMTPYRQAIGGYEQALRNFGQGLLPAYDQSTQQMLASMAQGAGDYEQRMNQMMKRYGSEARGTEAQALASGRQALGAGQNTINQAMRAGMARTGLGQTGVGQAGGALARSASAYAAPQLAQQYSQNMGQIAGTEAGMRGQTGANLMNAAYQRAGAGLGAAGTRLGTGAQMATTRLGGAGTLLGANQDLANMLTGNFAQGAGMGVQNLYARLAMMPQMWGMLNQQDIYDKSREFDWGGFLRDLAGVGLGGWAMGGFKH